MTTVYKVLGQSAPAAATDTNLYVVPAATSAVCSTIVICNLGASTTYRIAIRPAGDVLENKHYLAYESAINQYDTVMLTIGITLSATDVVTVRSGTSNAAFQLFGSEIS